MASKTIQLSNRLFGVLLLRRSGFDPCSVHMGFVVNKVAMGQIFIRILLICLVRVIIPVLHARSLYQCSTLGHYTSAPRSAIIPMLHARPLYQCSTLGHYTSAPRSVIIPVLHTRPLYQCSTLGHYTSAPHSVIIPVLHARPLYQCSTLDLIYLLNLPEGQTGEDWKPSKSSALPKIPMHHVQKYFISFRLCKFQGMFERSSFHQLVLQVKK